jgi:hypothetical protein
VRNLGAPAFKNFLQRALFPHFCVAKRL